MRKFLMFVVVIALLAVAANDLSRYSKAKSRLTDATYQLSKYAADAAVSKSPTAVEAEVRAMAAPFQVSLTQYAQGDNKVQLWTQTQVSGTIVVGTVANMVGGMSFSEARKKPFTISEFRQAGI